MITTNLNCLIARSIDKNYEMKLIETSEAEKLLKTYYSEAFKCAKKGAFIYRGQNENFDNKPFISIPDYRMSENTSNEYTHLMSDVLPSWAKYPKRSHSFICTSDSYKASCFGTKTFIVLPKNGTKLGICPEEDIWDSFELISSLPDFNEYLRNFIEWVLYEISNSDDINIYSLLNFANKNVITNTFDYIDKIVLNYLSIHINAHYPYKSFEINYILDQYKKSLIKLDKKGSLIKILDDMLNPKKNKFTLTNIKNYSSFSGKNNEIWFDNEALFMPIELKDWIEKL